MLDAMYANHRLPLWTRVLAFAVDHHGLDLAEGELRFAVDPLGLVQAPEVARAIRHCKATGVLSEGSSARGLYVVDLIEREAA